MANWLQKILPPAPPRGQTRRNLPANVRRGPLPAPFGTQIPGQLPNASIIYGIAASALLIISLYFLLFEHRFVAGFLVMLLAACFLGFALHFLRFPK
jgi:hypothetical protein